MLEKKHLVFLAGATAPFAPPLCTALEHRRLISHSSSGTLRDEMETEILRKVQQECGSWRETKESYLKGDWQTATFCYVLCSLHLFAMR